MIIGWVLIEEGTYRVTKEIAVEIARIEELGKGRSGLGCDWGVEIGVDCDVWGEEVGMWVWLD